MESIDIFVRTLLVDKVKVRPYQLSQDLSAHLQESLQKKFEGLCSYHGYIKPGSISVFKYSPGTIQALSLNGDVEYNVNYYADVCNPSVGSIVHTKVVNTNKFGALAHTGIRDPISNTFAPILEIVIAKNMASAASDKNVDECKIGDEIHVEILGKRFELMDKKIAALGRIIDTDKEQTILDSNGAILSDTEKDPEDPDDADEDAESDEEDEGSNDGEADDNDENEEAASVNESEEASDEESQIGGIASDGFFSEGDEAASDFGGSEAGFFDE